MVTGKGGHGAVPRHSCDVTLPQRHNFRHGMDALVSSLRRGDWKEKSWSQLRAGKEEGETWCGGKGTGKLGVRRGWTGFPLWSWVVVIGREELCRIRDHTQSSDRCNVYHTGSVP